MLIRRNSLQKSLCPVVICPYLCSSESPEADRSTLACLGSAPDRHPAWLCAVQGCFVLVYTICMSCSCFVCCLSPCYIYLCQSCLCMFRCFLFVEGCFVPCACTEEARRARMRTRGAISDLLASAISVGVVASVACSPTRADSTSGSRFAARGGPASSLSSPGEEAVGSCSPRQDCAMAEKPPENKGT